MSKGWRSFLAGVVPEHCPSGTMSILLAMLHPAAVLLTVVLLAGPAARVATLRRCFRCRRWVFPYSWCDGR